MKTMKSMHIALFGALLLVAGSVSVWAQAPQQTRDQSQSDSSTPNKSKKTKKTNADGSNSQGAPAPGSAATSLASTAPAAGKSAAAPATPASTLGRSAPASKTATTQQPPPANSGGMVWVNTDSGVYHKPGMRWYGKTKQGKYMTEADAQKAGYRAAAKH